jgi:hypothetical protein
MCGFKNKINHLLFAISLQMTDGDWRESKIENFKVVFHGAAVDKHEIDADDLATSLMGISEVIEESHKLLYNQRYSEVYIKVKSDFQPSSFLVALALILTSTDFTALANLTSLIGFCGFDVNSLLQLIRKTKGNKIVNKTKISGDQFNVKFEGCEFNLQLNENQIKLLESKKIRKGLHTITKAFDNKGISDIEFKDECGEPEHIYRDEIDIFKAPQEDIEDEKTDTDIFLVTRPDLLGRKKGWRFSEGFAEGSYEIKDFPVTILDEKFLDDVKKGHVIITQGTKIRAQYKKTIVELENLTKRYEILKVIEVGQVKRKFKELSDFT